MQWQRLRLTFEVRALQSEHPSTCLCLILSASLSLTSYLRQRSVFGPRLTTGCPRGSKVRLHRPPLDPPPHHMEPTTMELHTLRINDAGGMWKESSEDKTDGGVKVTRKVEMRKSYVCAEENETIVLAREHICKQKATSCLLYRNTNYDGIQEVCKVQ